MNFLKVDSSFKLGEESIDKRKFTMYLLFLGDSNTGKSFIIKSLDVSNNKDDDYYSPTFGLKHYNQDYSITIKKDERLVFFLDIIDTSGQEQYKFLTSLVLKQRNHDGIVLVYSTKKRESFQKLESEWLKQIQEYIDIKDINLMIIANKYDHGKEDQIDKVSDKEGEDLAKKYGASFLIYRNKEDKKGVEDNLIRTIYNKKNNKYFGRFGSYKVVQRTRLSYHSVCPYFSDTYTTLETYEDRIVLNPTKKKEIRHFFDDDDEDKNPKKRRKKKKGCA